MVCVIWCYFTFVTAVVNIVTDPTQVRNKQGQFSVVVIGYVQFVAAFVPLLLSLVEVWLVACCLCSTEYRPCVGGYF